MVIEYVLDFPTLASLLQTNKFLHALLSENNNYNSENSFNNYNDINNNIWFRLMQKRYQININVSSSSSSLNYNKYSSSSSSSSLRPKTCSASDWKNACKNLSSYKNIRI